MCFRKGKSLNKITQETLDEVFSNINSYVRKSKGDKAPYDLVRAKFGKPFLDAINIQRIDNKKVKLTQLIWPLRRRQRRRRIFNKMMLQ